MFESASLATRCRFFVPELISKLRISPKWCHLRSIQVKIGFIDAPHAPQIKIESQVQLTLTEETAQLLENCAKEINDVQLKGVLERMASIAKARSKN